MFTHLTGQSRRVLQLAHQEAIERNHDYLGTEHLLLAMLRESGGAASRVLEECRIPTILLLQDLDAELEPGERILTIEKLPLTLAAQRALQFAREEAQAMHQPETGLEHLLLAILREEDCQAAQLLEHHGLTLEACRGEIARHAVEENRDRLVQTSLPALPGVGRDPTPLELEDRLTPEILPREWKPDVNLPSPLIVQVMEAQLRGTQLVLGACTGGFAMVEMYGWPALPGGILIGLLVAAFQSSVLGALFGGIAGFFIGFQYRALGAWIVLATAMAGFFVGSWLGNAWRISSMPPSAPRADDE